MRTEASFDPATPPGTRRTARTPRLLAGKDVGSEASFDTATPPGAWGTARTPQLLTGKDMRTAADFDSATPPGAWRTARALRLLACKDVRTEANFDPATPPGSRQTHTQWACRPIVTVKSRVRSRVTQRGRRSSPRGGQTIPFPTRGTAARRDSAVRPGALLGQEREREREMCQRC